MTWIEGFLCLVSFAGGAVVSGALFALMVKLGIFTRLVQLTGLKGKTWMLESGILAGGIFGCCTSLFNLHVPLGTVGLLVMGSFFGCYVGWLNMALAETLSVFSIAFRRIGLKFGIGVVLFSIAVGKVLGALLYFYNGWGT